MTYLRKNDVRGRKPESLQVTSAGSILAERCMITSWCRCNSFFPSYHIRLFLGEVEGRIIASSSSSNTYWCYDDRDIGRVTSSVHGGFEASQLVRKGISIKVAVEWKQKSLLIENEGLYMSICKAIVHLAIGCFSVGRNATKVCWIAWKRAHCSIEPTWRDTNCAVRSTTDQIQMRKHRIPRHTTRGANKDEQAVKGCINRYSPQAFASPSKV